MPQMAIYTRSEICKKFDMPSNRLSTYIERGKVIKDENNMFDLEHPKNKAFYEKILSKRGNVSVDAEVIEPEVVTAKVVSSKKPPKESKGTDGISLFDLELKKKKVDIELKEAEIRLKNIEEQKKLGELIPVDIVKTMIMTQAQSQVTSFKDAMDLFLVRISAKKKLTLEETAELKGGLIELINKAIDTSVENSKKTMRKIIDELSE